MVEKLIKAKGTIAFLGPGEIRWTVETGSPSHPTPRAKSFGGRVNNCRSV